jgi:hypothetical protein
MEARPRLNSYKAVIIEGICRAIEWGKDICVLLKQLTCV